MRGDELLFDHHQDNKDLVDLSDKAEFEDIRKGLQNSLIDWMKANDDIHIEGDSLRTVPIKETGFTGKVGYTNSPWNNRGWRG